MVTTLCVSHNKFLRSLTIVVDTQTYIVEGMAQTKLTKLELQIMDALWTRGTASIREPPFQCPQSAHSLYGAAAINCDAVGMGSPCSVQPATRATSAVHVST